MGMGGVALLDPASATPDLGVTKSIEKKSRKDKKSKKDKKEKREKKEKKDKKRLQEKNSDDALSAERAPEDTPPKRKWNSELPVDGSSEKRMRFVKEGASKDLYNSGDMDDAEDVNLGDDTVTEVVTNDINSFGMSKTTIQTLESKGITSLFDIQAATFKLLRYEGKDVIGRARTGSGKTLAFVLPIVESITADNLHRTSGQNKPIALCLAPTRELAQQVHTDFELVAGAHRMSTAVFTGGTAKGPQYGQLRRGIDVLVGTPGRVLDHLKETSLNLSNVRYVVLDEADEMLSMGFQEDVETILRACSSGEKQTLLFSATVPRWVKDLAAKYMRKDNTVTVDTVKDEKNRTSGGISHYAISCPYSERDDTLADVVKVYTGALGKTIIFTDTKAEANEVGAQEKLVNALGGAGVLHGDIPQGQRETTLKAYRDGKIRVLVATSVAARGLDIKEVDLVVQLHPPTDYTDYIHRSGRTGRAGKTGTCVMFYSQREKYLIGLIEHKAGIRFKRANAPQAKEIVKASVDETVKKIENVHEDNVELFREVARKVVKSFQEKNGGGKDGLESALAAALSCMAGYTNERFKSRSLLSCFQGFTAVLLRGDAEFESSGHAWSCLRRVLGAEICQDIKGTQVCKDKCVAIFDVPDGWVDAVKEAARDLKGKWKLEIAEEMPELEQGEFDMKNAMRMLDERKAYQRGKWGKKGGGGGGRWSGGGGGGGNGGGGWRRGGGGGGGGGGGWGRRR